MSAPKITEAQICEFIKSAKSTKADAAVAAIHRVREGIIRGVRYPYTGAPHDPEASAQHQATQSAIVRFLDEAADEARKAADQAGEE